MKNFIKYLITLLVFVLAIPASSWAQGADPVITFDPATWFVTLGAFVAVVMVVTQFAKKLINASGMLAKLLSWLVSVILGAIGWLMQLGIFTGIEWYWALIYALSAGLLSNGIFDIGVVTAILNFIKSFQKPK